MTRRHGAIGFLLLATWPTVLIAGQIMYGTIAGTVRDAQGTPVSGALVIITNQANGLKRAEITDLDGAYTIRQVPVAAYDFQVTLGRTVKPFLRSGVNVSRGEIARVDAQFEAGPPPEVFTVVPEYLADLAHTPRPFVKLEKSRFLVGEHVFFWVGVSGFVPEILCDTGQILITRPDGTERVDKAGCPVDRPLGLGWQGGHSLGAEIPQLGRWAVAYEFARHRSESATFTVERDDIVNQIEATFVFSSPLVLDSPEAFATLTVRNRSAETIRFPHRNRDNLVSVRLNKTTGEAWSSDFFVPQDVLFAASGSVQPRISSDSLSFTWELADQVPTVSLPPGQAYQLRLPLAAVLEGSGPGGLARIPAGEHEIRLYTLLQTLVGSPDGAWKDLSPLRLQVTGTARGIRR